VYLFLEILIELARLIPQVGNTENLPILSCLNHQPDNISDLMLRHPTQPFPRLTRIPPTHRQIRRST
jgi:hypothetical protein